MKKRALFLILLSVILLCVCACGGDKTDPKTSDTLYSLTVGADHDSGTTGAPATDGSTTQKEPSAGAEPSVIWTPNY